jgi:hypothetical protein
MSMAGADAELQQFAKTFDDVKFRKGEMCFARLCHCVLTLQLQSCNQCMHSST